MKDFFMVPAVALLSSALRRTLQLLCKYEKW